MVNNSSRSIGTAMFNKYGFNGKWPRAWVLILGIFLAFFTFAIAGMEVGHTIYDLFRSTAFGGFIVFFPLLFCAIFVMITAYVPKLTLLRVTVVLCVMMIFLCMVVITYDIFVLVDPTRCFFFYLSCSLATVDTPSGTVTGWPLTITWPTAFATKMNGKRLLQSLQLFCAILYMFFAALYIVTFAIYRHIRSLQQAPYHVSRSVYPSHDTGRVSEKHVSRAPSPVRPTTRTVSRNSNYNSSPYTHHNPNHKVTVYTIEGKPDPIARRYIPGNSSPLARTTMTPRRSKAQTFIRPRANSTDELRLCTRCNREPKMVLETHYERQNYFSHLCRGCNKELSEEHQKTPHHLSPDNRHWIP